MRKELHLRAPGSLDHDVETPGHCFGNNNCYEGKTLLRCRVILFARDEFLQL